jgi:2-dehydro-3-deoxyphosphooctonate aldolase (KDO 8-P synthase)
MSRRVTVGSVQIGAGGRFAFIGGTCTIEGRDSALRHAAAIREITDALAIPFVYKSSFDKANRTSVSSPRGPGIDEGLAILAEVRREIGVPVVTDVHESSTSPPSPRSSTCCRSRPFSAGRPTCCWPPPPPASR